MKRWTKVKSLMLLRFLLKLTTALKASNILYVKCKAKKLLNEPKLTPILLCNYELANLSK